MSLKRWKLLRKTRDKNSQNFPLFDTFDPPTSQIRCAVDPERARLRGLVHYAEGGGAPHGADAAGDLQIGEQVGPSPAAGGERH